MSISAANSLQNFEDSVSPHTAKPRLELLRQEIGKAAVSAFLVPRADAFGNEWVAAGDERLAWLTGFTGSYGICAVTSEDAGIFVDGRYKIQVRSQLDSALFKIFDTGTGHLSEWLSKCLAKGSKVGFDPWLHTHAEAETLQSAFNRSGIELRPTNNLVDQIWRDRPGNPNGMVFLHSNKFAGEDHKSKCARIAKVVSDSGCAEIIISRPDCVAWLLNIRGSDIAHTPILNAFAILHAESHVDVYAESSNIPDAVKRELADTARFWPISKFESDISELKGPVLLDSQNTRERIFSALAESNISVVEGPDPCVHAKAIKNHIEIEGAIHSHEIDGIAMVEFLSWLDKRPVDGKLTEIDAILKLEEFRRNHAELQGLSFETICGSGPNGAIIHYRATQASNRTVNGGELLLIDSGGQYLQGTTDITRTVAIGHPSDEMRKCFTMVLIGLISLSSARWPEGIAGRDLDAIARYSLWISGRDYDHGTGHGVGSYLGVHEGPQRISRTSQEPLVPGMILSIEPGYYRESEFGIRIENLVVVQTAPPIKGADARPMLHFKTLSHTPIDQRLINTEMLTRAEKSWLDNYHAATFKLLAGRCSASARAWLERACAPVQQ